MAGRVGVEPRWDLPWLRDQLPVLRNVTYLNAAHQGVTADPVAAWTLGAIGQLELLSALDVLTGDRETASG